MQICCRPLPFEPLKLEKGSGNQSWWNIIWLSEQSNNNLENDPDKAYKTESLARKRKSRRDETTPMLVVQAHPNIPKYCTQTNAVETDQQIIALVPSFLLSRG